MQRFIFATATVALLASGITARAGQALAYSNDFDGGESFLSGVSGGFSGFVHIESVQGYAGIGSGSDVFGGNFLRNYSGRDFGGVAQVTRLVLNGLPDHTSINLGFLFAVIDTWDSRATGGFDIFNIRVDGTAIFSQGFANVEDGTTMSYVPPTGVALTSSPFPQLGWLVDEPGWNHESAYNLGLDPSFHNIAHTSSTLTIEWYATGERFIFQGGDDESWGIENVRVTLNGVAVPEPTTIALAGSGILAMLGYRFRRFRAFNTEE